ncbi:MAG: MAPEG family protein [Casimicrobiaceae bacterium]
MTNNPAPVTALYAALCAFIILVLALRIMVMRWQTKTGIGDGGNSRLTRAIRVHGNAIEYVPIALILMLVAELGGARPALLHGCGVVLVVARVAHAMGLLRTPGLSIGRGIGVTGTVGVIAVLAVADVLIFLK